MRTSRVMRGVQADCQSGTGVQGPLQCMRAPRADKHTQHTYPGQQHTSTASLPASPPILVPATLLAPQRAGLERACAIRLRPNWLICACVLVCVLSCVCIQAAPQLANSRARMRTQTGCTSAG